MIAIPAGAQSALAPTGVEAERVALLSWVMFSSGTLILILVCVAAYLAMYGPARWRKLLSAQRFIVGAGLVFPTVTLTILLAVGLMMMRGGVAAGDTGEDIVRISVVGEQWWWRVIYEDTAEDIEQTATAAGFETANELRIPVGRPVEIALTSADVIHSFWVPALAGKLDMIPGRTNTLTLIASEPGVSRGQCAEYCGGAHTLMSFFVEALPEAEYQAWVAAQAEDAAPPRGEREQEGQRLFIAAGCGGCHAVRGTDANGVIGPDLTHVGGRLSIAAATLPNTTEALTRWIRDSQHIKPENRMPPYGFLAEGDAETIAAWLTGLE